MSLLPNLRSLKPPSPVAYLAVPGYRTNRPHCTSLAAERDERHRRDAPGAAVTGGKPTSGRTSSKVTERAIGAARIIGLTSDFAESSALFSWMTMLACAYPCVAL